MSADLLKDVQLVREQELLQRLFAFVSKNGACAFGVRETMEAFDAGAIDILIIYEELDTLRCRMRCPDGSQTVAYFSRYQIEHGEHLRDNKYEAVVEQEALADWMAENHQLRGVRLEYVTGKSPEGAQFIKGLGGIGAILRYQLGFGDYQSTEEGGDDGFDSDFDIDANIF
jgi:peptide chain release factor subunit 1